MARPRTTGRGLGLGPEIDALLDDFCRAHHGANAKEVVRRALAHFIPHDLDANPGIKREFDRLQTLRSQKPSLKVVPLKGGGTEKG